MRWKPKKDQLFYMLDHAFRPVARLFTSSYEIVWESGNCFATREEALTASGLVKSVFSQLEGEHWKDLYDKYWQQWTQKQK